MPHAIVAGGGIAGLAAAIGLVGGGWTVSVYERAPAIEPIGAALSIWPNAIEALRTLGVGAAAASAGAPIRAMLLSDQRGRVIIGPRTVPPTAVMMTRSALQQVLRDNLGDAQLCLGCGVLAADQSANGVAVTLTDGHVVTADLLIDAGGIRSVIDAGLFKRPVTYRGYGGVLALSNGVGSSLNGLAAEYWGRNERFGVFELPDDRRYWFYMRDQPAEADSPSYDQVNARVEGWPNSVSEAVGATHPDRLLPFKIYAKALPNRLGVGRVISVGDAAHAMEPNLGQGACQGLEDAAALSAIASLTPTEMLPAFERLRLKRARAIVRRSAEGRYGVHGSVAAQTITRTLIRGLPQRFSENVMRSAQTMPNYADVMAGFEHSRVTNE